jgi:DNA-binding Xre family transcriptional regulator
MTNTAKTRVPFTYFLPYIRTGKGAGGANKQGFDCRVGQSDIATALKVSRRAIQRWRHQGVPVENVDELCEFLGHHPSEILGRDYVTTGKTPPRRLVDDPILGDIVREMSSA